jgi:hypothetical protein
VRQALWRVEPEPLGNMLELRFSRFVMPLQAHRIHKVQPIAILRKQAPLVTFNVKLKKAYPAPPQAFQKGGNSKGRDFQFLRTRILGRAGNLMSVVHQAPPHADVAISDVHSSGNYPGLDGIQSKITLQEVQILRHGLDTGKARTRKTTSEVDRAEPDVCSQVQHGDRIARERHPIAFVLKYLAVNETIGAVVRTQDEPYNSYRGGITKTYAPITPSQACRKPRRIKQEKTPNDICISEAVAP